MSMSEFDYFIGKLLDEDSEEIIGTPPPQLAKMFLSGEYVAYTQRSAYKHSTKNTALLKKIKELIYEKYVFSRPYIN